MLATLFFTDVHAQNPANVGFSVCVRVIPVQPQRSFTLLWQRSRRSYPLTDTCVQVTALASHSARLLVIEADGYVTQQINIRSDTLRAGQTIYVNLIEKINQLDEVRVRSKQTSWSRGDTLVINAGAVETEPNGSASELLDNIAEATSFGGTLRIGGKEIGKVYINGKETKEGNLSSVLNSLRADMIKTIDVYPRTVDGREMYVMDIKLNTDRQRGFYGNGLVGGGSRDVGYGRVNRIDGANLLTIQATKSSANDLYRFLGQTRSEPPEVLPFNKAYSLAEFVENSRYQSVVFKPRPVNEYDLSLGDNRLFGGSAALSQALGKRVTLTAGVGYEESTRRQATETLVRTITGPTDQRVQTVDTDSTRPRQLTANWQFVWRPAPADVIKLAGNLTHESTVANELGRQNSQLLVDSEELVRANITRQLNRQLLATVSEQRVMWTHRFRRPAQVFSVFAGVTADQGNTGQAYQNRFDTNDQQRIINQQTLRNVNGRSFDWQMRFARPVSRRWLIEATMQQTRDQYTTNQTGYVYQFATGRYGTFIPALSVADFTSVDEQQAVRALLVHRTARLRLIAGSSLTALINERVLTALPVQNRQVVWNPYVVVSYRLGSQTGNQTQLTTSLKRYQQSPVWSNLVPVTDSTSVTNIVRGNPQLIYSSTQQAEGSVRVISERRGELDIRLRYEYTTNPVLPVITYDNTTSFSNITYRQAASEKRWELACAALLPKLTENLSLFVNAKAAYSETYTFLNDQLNRYRTDNYEVNVNAKWLPLRFVTIQLSNLSGVDIQRSETGQAGTSFRNRLSVNGKARLFASTYVELQSFITFSRFPGGNFTGQTPQIVLNAYRLLTKKRNLKLNLLINNPFGSAVTNVAYSGLNTLYQTRTRQLPPLVLVGLNYYFSAWQKTK